MLAFLKENCHDKSCIVCVRGLSRDRKRSHGVIHSCTTVSNATTASTTDSKCDDCHDDDDDCKCIIHVHKYYIIL